MFLNILVLYKSVLQKGQVHNSKDDAIRQGMSNLQMAAPMLPAQPEARPDNNGTDQENYEIAEAFLKDMGL
jgi:hypothetical protein